MALDPYAVLGVAPSATAVQITSAYRSLVRSLHPDANPGRPAAQERFAEVLAAYDTLRDPERRAAHDSGAGRAAQPRRPRYRVPAEPPLVVDPVRQPPLRVGPVRIAPLGGPVRRA